MSANITNQSALVKEVTSIRRYQSCNGFWAIWASAKCCCTAWRRQRERFSHRSSLLSRTTVALYSSPIKNVSKCSVKLDAINSYDGGVRSVHGDTGTAGIFASYPAPYISVVGGVIDQVKSLTTYINNWDLAWVSRWTVAEFFIKNMKTVIWYHLNQHWIT